MIKRVGSSLLIAGIFALITSLIMTGGNLVQPSFSERQVLFQAAILLICLGLSTILLVPETTKEVVIATGIGVGGQFSLSLAILVAGGAYSSPLFPLLQSVIPLLPMGIGYMAGALRTVPDLSNGRRRTISVIGAFVGLLTWIGPYLLILRLYDTTGEMGLHPGFLFMGHMTLLLVNLAVGGCLYVLWRLFGPTSSTSVDQTGHRSNSANLDQ